MNLPLKAKYFYDGNPNPFEDVSKSIGILRKELLEATQVLSAFNKEKLIALKSNPKDSSKDYQEINKGLVELEKNNKLLVLIETKRMELEKAQEKLNQERLKSEQQLQKLQQEKNKVTKTELDNTIKSQKEKERLIKIQNKEAEVIKKSADAYNILVKQTNNAQKEFKRLAVEFGLNSKQAKAAKADFEKLDGQLRKVNDAAKDGHRDVGRYAIGWQGVKTSLLSTISALGITGGIAGALSLAKGVMESTEGTADKFRETVSGLGGALGFMGRALANMDFSNLIQGMKDAYTEGVRYEKGLDLSKDLKRSLDIQMKLIDGEQSTQKKIAKIKSNDLAVRQAAIDEIIRLEEERLKKTKVYTEQQLNNELTNAEKITKSSRELILELISNRDKYIDKIEEGAAIEQKIIDETTEKRADARTGIYVDIVNTEKQKKLLSELSDEQKYLIELNKLDQKLVGDKRDLVAEALKQNIDADNALIFKEESLARLKNSLYNEYIKETEAVNKANESNNILLNSLEGLRKKVSELNQEREKTNINDVQTLFNKQQEIDKINEQIKSLENLGKVIKENEEIQFEPDIINIQNGGDYGFEEENKRQIDAEIAKFEALKSIDERGYTSLLDIFFKFSTKKKAEEQNLNAEEIAELDRVNTNKVNAITDLVNTIKDIYTDLLDSRIEELQLEIDATNQKINETEQALNRETTLLEKGAANNVNTERKKLEELKKQRDKDLAEQKKLQKEKENVDKLSQISSLVTAVANIISSATSELGWVGVIAGLVAAAAAIAGFTTYSDEAKSAVGEDGMVITNKGTHLETGKRHSQGGNQYDSANFEVGEAHSIFSREATQRNYKDIEQFTDLVNSGKWDLYKNSIGNNMTNLIVNNDHEQLLKEARRTNQLLSSQLRPVYNNGKLVTFNINGVKVRSEN